MKSFHILSIFPKVFASYFNESILGRAQEQKTIEFHYVDIRNYTENKHKQVDDSPYGGGAGMIMQIEPIYKAVMETKKKIQQKHPEQNTRTILFSAKGKPFEQSQAKRLVKYDNLIFICGRYEGVDERVAKYIVDEEMRVGDYVLTGGELPAMVVVDAVSRLLPGVLGNQDSLSQESHCKKGYLEYPQYTRPSVFENKSGLISKIKSWKVPQVLLSGDHGKIKKWREENSK